MAPRLLLVLPTQTYRAAAFLRAARALEMEVVVASDRPPVLADMMTGGALTLDLGAPGEAAERAAELARRLPLDGVVGVDEQAVLTAAHVAARLGLRHSPVEAVEATRDKRLLRTRLAAAGVPQPRFVEVRSGDAAAEAKRAAAVVGLPAVVKPVDGTASRGVIRADDVSELAAAVRRVHAMREADLACQGEIPPPGGVPLLVEAFVAGAEVAVEGLLRSGRLDVLAVFDKPDPLDGPFFEETLFVTPSRLPAAALRRVEEVTAAAAAALGLTEGAVHAEARVTADGVVVIEVAARSIGGLCSQALRFVRSEAGGATVSLEELILLHAAGLPLPVPLRREAGAAGVLMLPTRRTGTLRGVAGVAEARALPGVDGVTLSVPLGQRVIAPPEGDRYLGFVFAHGRSPGLVEASLRAAEETLVVDIEPDAPTPSAVA